MRHPNIDPILQDAIEEVAGNKDLKLDELKQGTIVELRTRSGSLYILVVINPDNCEVALFCDAHKELQTPELFIFQGSTFGGSVTKVGWIVVGMHPKFNRLRDGGLLITSALQGFTVSNDPERARKITDEAEVSRPKPPSEEELRAAEEKIEEIIRGFGEKYAERVRILTSHFNSHGVGWVLGLLTRASEENKLDDALEVLDRHLKEHWLYRPPFARGSFITESDTDYVRLAYRELGIPLPEQTQSP